MIFKGYLFALLYGILCMGLAMLAYKLGMPKKYSRKLVHILVGFEWVILYSFFGVRGDLSGGLHTLAVCLGFTVLLLILYLNKLSPMMSSDDDNAPGTVYYGVAMSCMALVCIFIPKFVLYFGIGVFATSLGDGFAGLVGQLVQKYNPKIYGKKTLFGFLANFAVSSLVPFVFDCVFHMGFKPWQYFFIGALCALVELISSYGLDNITVTFSASFLSFMLLNLPTYKEYLVPILATPIIIALVVKKKALTPSATFLAVVLDVVVSLVFGNYGFILLLMFLVGSVLIDKIKKKKQSDDGITKRGECRDSIQVIANGIIPMIMAILYATSFDTVFIVAYVAAVSEAFADTAASGLGVYSKSTFDLFKWRKCEKGISGGMSVVGTLASLLASFVIPAVALAFGMINLPMMLLASALAFLGVLFDSMLGSYFQVKYKCKLCGKVTEREVHCETKTDKHSGFVFFDNDVVNLFSGIFSALLAVFLSGFII